MKPVPIRTERLDIGSYYVEVIYYHDDSLDVTIFDETGEIIEGIWITDEEEETGFNFNLN